jgi:hypothetical protein
MTDLVPRLNAALEGRYRVERALGEGGMAIVYLAEDLRHDRQVAIKVLKPELAAVVGGERFLAEIRTTANLQHPHILPLFDSGEADRFLYFVTPYVAGESLRDRIARERELPVDEAVALARKVAGALDSAHRQGVIHRDVKPENILLQEDGEPLVADFGIALAVQHAGGGRLTETGLSLGTPAYMAPEQASGDREPDVRSDVYGLGCVAYEMLAGRPPYVGRSAQQILAKVLTEDPPPLTRERKQVPGHVAAAVGTALQRVPGDRFGSARAFAEALDDPAFRGLAREWDDGHVRRPGLGVAALTGAVGLAAGVLVASLVPGGDAGEPLSVFRQITHTGTVGCAAISPDGTQVALIQGSYTEETSCGGALVVRALPAGVPIVLVDSVGQGGELAWSPDGSSLLVRGSISGQSGQYLVPVGGSAPRRLGPPLEFATFKTADSVVVLFGGEMRVVDPRSGAELRRDTLERSIMSADWSEEAGAWVTAYFAPGRPLGVAGVLALMDEEFRPTDSLPGFPVGVAWAGPDHILVHEAGPHGLSSRSIREVPVAGTRFGGEPRILRDAVLPRDFLAPSSTDGRRALVALTRAMDLIMGAELRDTSSSSIRVVARSVGSWITSPSISPDGRQVAYYRTDLLGPNPYVTEFDGGIERPLGSREGRLRDAATWAPDGERLILHGHAEMPLAAFEVGTGTERELDGTRGCYLGTLAGGGLLVANTTCFVRAQWEPLRIVDTATGSFRELPDLPGTPRWIVQGPRRDRLWATAGLAGETDGLYSLEPDGAEWVDHGTFPGARASGHQLLGVDDEGRIHWMESGGITRLFRVAPGSDQPQLLREFGFECVVGSAAVTPDLDRFVCNASQVDADAWLVERGVDSR